MKMKCEGKRFAQIFQDNLSILKISIHKPGVDSFNRRLLLTLLGQVQLLQPHKTLFTHFYIYMAHLKVVVRIFWLDDWALAQTVFYDGTNDCGNRTSTALGDCQFLSNVIIRRSLSKQKKNDIYIDVVELYESWTSSAFLLSTCKQLFDLVWFYGISTMVSYLMPNQFYTYKLFYFKQFSSA